ncbi:MAG: hypothetical protein H6720_25390 [Sandaracinus sp.]|nr:hypothetical protein [Sandaracinus sp.]
MALGCGGRDPRPTEPSVEPTPEVVVGAGTFSVHEWGLLRGGAGDVLEVGAVPPATLVEPIAVDKPLLYFHATGGPVRLREATVDALDGSIREHWPVVADATPTRVTWRDLALDPSRVVVPGRCEPVFPTRTQPPCDRLAPGEACETAELAPLRAEGSTCLDEAPFLFYRSRTRSFTPPLRATREGDAMRVTNAGREPIPGRLIRIERFGGRVRTRAVEPPAPGGTIVIDATFPEDGDSEPMDDVLPADRRGAVDELSADGPVLGPSTLEAGRRALRDTLEGLGLTDSESDAFVRAWDHALFGEFDSVDGLPAPVHSILYFLPPGACDQVATLHFDPAPTEVHRALAVWVRVD